MGGIEAITSFVLTTSDQHFMDCHGLIHTVALCAILDLNVKTFACSALQMRLHVPATHKSCTIQEKY